MALCSKKRLVSSASISRSRKLKEFGSHLHTLQRELFDNHELIR